MHGYLVISHAKSSKVETWIKLHLLSKRPKNRKGWNLNGCIPCVGEYWTTLGNESTGKMLFLLEGEIVCLFYCCCVLFSLQKHFRTLFYSIFKLVINVSSTCKPMKDIGKGNLQAPSL